MGRRMQLLFRQYVVSAIICTALWFVVAGYDPASLTVGIPTIVIATLAMAGLTGTGDVQFSFIQAPYFALFFVRSSVAGGIDVARRALSPSLPVDPAFIEFVPRIPPGPARVFFLHVVSQLPGTLIADSTQEALLVHVVSRSQPNEPRLRKLEEHVARLFRVGLDSTPEPEGNPT